MFLEKIEIQGFKSFANRTIIEFPKSVGNKKGITAIVGPNGSGKSNVADAIRWVLGEQSAKMLRGKKAQDVIFSGSDKKARLGFAEVSLYLNNEDHAGGIEYAELVITRRIYRDGEGEYLLNKNKVRLADIQLLLAKANFGQRTYSVIGQGMADAVLSSSLQERKEFFDEAVGVKQYQIKRDQALNKFKATRENLAQTQLTIGELDPQLKSLTRQMKRLEKREEIERELKLCQVAYYSQVWHGLNTTVRDLLAQNEALAKQQQALETALTGIEGRIDEASKADTRQTIFSQLQQEHQSIVSKKNALLRQEALLKSQLDAEFQKQGKTNLVWLDRKKAELLDSITAQQAQITHIQQQEELERKALGNKKSELETLDKRLTLVRAEIEETKKMADLGPFDQERELDELFSQQQRLVDALIETSSLEGLESIKSRARELTAKFATYVDKFKKLSNKEKRDLAQLQSQLEDLTNQKNQLLLAVNQLELNISLKSEKLSTIRADIEKKESELAGIESELAVSGAETKDEASEQIRGQIEKIQQDANELDAQLRAQERKIEEFNAVEETKKSQMIALQREFAAKQNELTQLSHRGTGITVELTKHQTRIEDVERDMAENQVPRQEIGDAPITTEETKEQLLEKIHYNKRQIDLIGGIDEETKREYEDVKQRYEFLTTQVQDLENAIVSLEKIIDELDATIKQQFDRAFGDINREFQKFFKILFNGGNAELIKVSASDIKQEEEEENERSSDQEGKKQNVLDKAAAFEKRMKQRERDSYSGIEIKAVPPGKKMSSIQMLSGGERALTSIALISAIISNNPSPFVCLDEMDAALDEANAIRFSEIIDELSAKTQFIAITHNRSTMYKGTILYGVTMGDDGVSKLLSVQIAEAEGYAK